MSDRDRIAEVLVNHRVHYPGRGKPYRCHGCAWEGIEPTQHQADALIAAGCRIVEPDGEWSRHMRSLLGRRVIVTIENDGPKPVEVTGTLLWFSNNALRDEEGFTGCAWPNLDTRAAE